jgi:hypothetical protein
MSEIVFSTEALHAKERVMLSSITTLRKTKINHLKSKTNSKFAFKIQLCWLKYSTQLGNSVNLKVTWI